MGETIIAFPLTPKTPATEEAVRNAGASTRIMMRLFNTELVAKLYEYLLSKLKVSAQETGRELVLYCRGERMMLTDQLGHYRENSVSVKVPIEYEIVSIAEESTTTASSTPSGARESSGPLEKSDGKHVASILQDRLSEAPEPKGLEHGSDQMQPVIQTVVPTTLSDRKPLRGSDVAVTQSDRKTKRKNESNHSKDSGGPELDDSKRRKKGTATLCVDTQNSESAQPPLPLNQGERREAFTVESGIGKIHIDAIACTEKGTEKIESLYREMLDREREIFTSLIESQAQWLGQIHFQMTSSLANFAKRDG